MLFRPGIVRGGVGELAKLLLHVCHVPREHRKLIILTGELGG